MTTFKMRLARIFVVLLNIVAFCLIIIVFVAQPMEVPSDSMSPEVVSGDRILVMRSSNVSRGKVAVFYSDELKIHLVKRAIGISGDLIEYNNGILLVNGVEYPEPYVKHASNDTFSFQVPEDSILFLGDNRNNSLDARFWDNPYISTDSITGVAIFRFYPWNRIGLIR